MDTDKGKAKAGKSRPRNWSKHRFVNALYKVVDDPAVDDLISWSHDGSSFIVRRPQDIAQDLLPKYFNHSDLSLFLGRLNTYGFRRVVADGWEFANEWFKRGGLGVIRHIEAGRKKKSVKVEIESDASSASCRAGDSEDLSDASDNSMVTKSIPPDIVEPLLGEVEDPCLEFLGKKYPCSLSPSPLPLLTLPSSYHEFCGLQVTGSSALTSLSGESSITHQLSTHTNHHSGLPSTFFHLPSIIQRACIQNQVSLNNEIELHEVMDGPTSKATFNYIATFGLNLGDGDERPSVPTSLTLEIGLSLNPNLSPSPVPAPAPPPRPSALLTQGQDAVGSESLPWSHSDIIIGDALAYCALFPPHHEFDKNTLVYLWMGAGFVLRDPMEHFATLFFEDCVSRGVFELSRSNSLSGNLLYKFKGDSDFVGSLFRSRRNDIVRMEGESNLSDVSPNVSHVSIRCGGLVDSSVFYGCKRFEQLKTLILLDACKTNIKQVPHDFFWSLKMLKVLDLSQSSLMELPTSIGNLKCLCYLDLSHTPINHLPEAIDNLKLLQTLKLQACHNLFALPRGMRKLVNLRHLDFDVRQLHSMPPGIGALTNIRTLSAFLIGTDEECDITQLKNLNNLSGSLFVSGLDYVSTKEEAEEACLSKKSHLKKLELCWNESLDEDVISSQMVLSSLQPNTSLEYLHISCFEGSKFPSWICDPSFYKLVSITLFVCEHCVSLPSLGRLPSLKFLNIEKFRKLSMIDHTFYGDLGITSYTAFPKLEKLLVEDMSDLEVWEEIKNDYFPCLVQLTVKSCPKLHTLFSLPRLRSLEDLEIIHCPMLASCVSGNLPHTVKTFIIEECPMIKEGLLNDKGQVAHMAQVCIDHEELSFCDRAQQAYI